MKASNKAGRAVVLILTTVGAIGCAADNVTTPGITSLASRSVAQDGRIELCHNTDQAPHLISVGRTAVSAHIRHGDYIARLVVDPQAENGLEGAHFDRITDAVLAARALRLSRNEVTTAACRITIDVARGVYTGSFDADAEASHERFPFIVDVPDVTLHGALSMRLDALGRPTGDAVSENEVSYLVPTRPLVFLPNTEAMIVVTSHPGGSEGRGVIIEGFAFQSARNDDSHGGMGIIALRAQDLVIRGNRFEKGLSSAGDLRSSTVVMERNHGRQLGANCSFCLAGGVFVAADNRLVDGGLGGIYVSAAIAHMPFSLGAAPVTTVEPDVLPGAGAVTATIRNNVLRGHSRLPIGFAIRVLGIGPSSSQIPQTSHVTVAQNEISGNTFGIIVDAGFPMANTTLRGDVDMTLAGNSIQGNCQSNLLVGFTRHTGSLGLTVNPYLRSSTFRLDLGGDLTWDDAWYAHPAGLDNELIVNGFPRANGTSHAFNQNACPGLGG